MRIGFFDSGMGGLTVLHEAMEAYPHAHYLYYADTDNVPYGTKKKKEINKLVLAAADFLARKKIDILVVACNTATSVAIKTLREKYSFPIIGMEPAVKPAAERSKGKTKQNRILVCATKLTLKEQKLIDLISDLKASDKVDLLSLQKLVRYAEDMKMNSKGVRNYLKKKMATIDWENYSSVVLGCTHFLYYRSLIQGLIPTHIDIIDGNKGTVNRMLTLLPEKHNQKHESKPKLSFYKSGKKAKANSFKKFLRHYSSIKNQL